MTNIELLERHLAEDRHLAVLITTRPTKPNEPQVSVVNAAVIAHPVSGDTVVALVARRGAKLANLRRNPYATVVARAGWEWAAASGRVELSGPDDPHPAFDGAQQRQMLRDIYHAAGGHHDDLEVYDEVMRRERRCAVLIHPDRVWSNPPGSQHIDTEESS